MCDMYDTSVLPILTYGSDVRDMSKPGLDVLDNLFLHYARCTILCDAIVYGECGRYPPGTFLLDEYIMIVLAALAAGRAGRKMVKSVFGVLNALHSRGFPKLVT